jgi:vancomycin resistance protein YoaR
MSPKHLKKKADKQSPTTIFHTFPKISAVSWFIFGGLLGFFFFATFVLIYFRNTYVDKVYPGIHVNGVEFGGKTKDQVEAYFANKNRLIDDTKFIFRHEKDVASISAEELQMGYDEELLANQAYSLGRSKNPLSDFSVMIQAYLSGINLPAAYRYDKDVLQTTLAPFVAKINKEPVEGLFTFENNRVVAFQPSSDGQKVDTEKIDSYIKERVKQIAHSEGKMKIVAVPIPIIVIPPRVTTNEANNLGINELIGVGTSSFVGSIPNRVFNINLAASRLNGVLIKPGEVFSFNRAIGDVSSLTGYKQAYVIQNGRTVLGDGGGVCQVSTTFFRAVLNAGLPVVERNPHAYRVSYYEQDSGPGVDAAIYTPNIDFKFKNDMDTHILVQAYTNLENYTLTFELYGTSDGRTVEISKPVITSTSPAPEPLYQDDPNLPKGEVKQVDFAAAGATVYFTRTVKKDGKVLIDEKFSTRYRPWQAVFLRGTKES